MGRIEAVPVDRVSQEVVLGNSNNGGGQGRSLVRSRGGNAGGVCAGWGRCVSLKPSEAQG